jgi:hypothetical protein
MNTIQYKALTVYLARRERLNRLLLLGDNIPDNLVSERKVLTALLNLPHDIRLNGQLFDYGALIENSKIGANRAYTQSVFGYSYK